MKRGSPWRGETAYQDPYRRRLYGRTVDDLHAINAALDAVYRRGFEEATPGVWLAQEGLAAVPRVLAVLSQVSDISSVGPARSILAELIALLLDACERGQAAAAVAAIAHWPPPLAETAPTLLTAAFFAGNTIVVAELDDSAALCVALFIALAGRPFIALDLVTALLDARQGACFAANAAVVRAHLENATATLPPPTDVAVTAISTASSIASPGIAGRPTPRGSTYWANRSSDWVCRWWCCTTASRPRRPRGQSSGCTSGRRSRRRTRQHRGTAGRLRDYLEQHPEIASLWMVDSTDPELFRYPFGILEPGRLYVGHEPWAVRDATDRALSVNRASEIQEWVLANPTLPMLNCGVVGGDRGAMMALAQHMIDLRERYPDNGSSDDMGFNMLMRSGFPLPIEHGRGVTSNFKHFETAERCPSIWRHKQARSHGRSARKNIVRRPRGQGGGAQADKAHPIR